MLSEGFLEKLDTRAGETLVTPIEFSIVELQALTVEDADEIIAHFNGQAMMRLPNWEVEFFEWLKREDLSVWEDLWAAEPEPYVVSISFLPAFLETGHGFPVCDLVTQDNYYFHKDFIVVPEGNDLVGIAMDKIAKHEHVTANEVFLLEVMQHPIDIWRFAYKYNLPLEGAKKMVKEYIEDDVILHVKGSSELGEYVEL